MLHTKYILKEDLLNEKLTQKDELFLGKSQHQEKRTMSVSVATKSCLRLGEKVNVMQAYNQWLL